MNKVDTSPANDIVVRVRNLRLGTVDGAEILHSVDYELRRSEIVGLVG